MASTITVDNIIGKTATDNVHIPGHVVAYHETYVDNISTTVQWSSVTEITTPSSRLTFSPKYANSKLLVRLSGDVNWGGGATGIIAKVQRDGVDFRPEFGGVLLFCYLDPASTNNHQTPSQAVLVDAVSTASTTFSVYGARYGGGTGTVHFGNSSPMILSVTEIAQ